MACGSCGGGKKIKNTVPQASRNNMSTYQAVRSSLISQPKKAKPKYDVPVPNLRKVTVKNYKGGAFSTKSNRCWKCNGLLYKKKRMSKSLFLFKCSNCVNEVFINSNGDVMEK